MLKTIITFSCLLTATVIATDPINQSPENNAQPRNNKKFKKRSDASNAKESGSATAVSSSTDTQTTPPTTLDSIQVNSDRTNAILQLNQVIAYCQTKLDTVNNSEHDIFGACVNRGMKKNQREFSEIQTQFKNLIKDSSRTVSDAPNNPNTGAQEYDKQKAHLTDACNLASSQFDKLLSKTKKCNDTGTDAPVNVAD